MAGKRTISDIARLAGVSKTTVSRVLNHKPDVDTTTRERILRIVEEEGFIPSITASGLAAGRSRLIGVLIPSFTWPFMGDVMRGAADVIADTPYELILYSISETTREKDKSELINRILATQLTAGVLAIFPGLLAKYVARLHTPDFPVVMIDDQELPPNIPWVGADNQGGAYAAVRHLLQLGHRRIAHIQGPTRYLCVRERYQGYAQALREAGLVPDPELVLEGDFHEVGGQQAARKLFALPPDRRPTAIFAGNDLMAYGVLNAADEYGLHIPRDIALVGFDDISSTTRIRPALTTVRQPFAEMGQQGIKLLLSSLGNNHHSGTAYGQGGLNFHGLPSSTLFGSRGIETTHWADDTMPARIQLATSLVVRASCGSPNYLATPLPEVSL
ncbi:MAG TPA: LacI family DNA-binding transcriptional regulator [Ktedonosporobacter sp.]|nr:LacI family DNA-binding transcriptional regulator [Ktedonosporobacter sp.]